jgi:polyphosphate kinase 2 (PPK2 family)
VLRQTSTGWAPWIVVEGTNPEYRAATVGKTLLEAMRKRLDHKPGLSAPQQQNRDAPPLLTPIDRLSILDKLDLSAALPKARYRGEMARLQRELALLTRQAKFADHTVVCVFEGMDAAGKGGAIRRVTAALDARLYSTMPIAAPSDEERAQPYLWRFWRHIPRKGRFTIYDRSWYGRVLVERIEGLCSENDWMRAYSEINEFEDQLTRNGTVVAKFWLQISKEEQLRRFTQREKTSFKQFKITAEDWRNREKWDAYQAAAADMIERTGAMAAPWILVEANDKYHARVKVLGSLVGALRDCLARA